MKNAILSLLLGVAAVSLQAHDSIEDASLLAIAEPYGFVPQHHEIKPQFRVLRHNENNYKYTKVIGGIEYKYFQAEGPNFNAFMGYSHTDHKTYFAADWDLSYIFNYSDYINIYPIVGFGNSSHFSSRNNGSDYHIFCSKFNGGVGSTFFFSDLISADVSLHYFKDISSTVILYKGNDFWGKRYHSPYGLRAAMELKFPNVMSKDIVVGGFYAQTIKDAYKEYGLNIAVVFAF